MDTPLTKYWVEFDVVKYNNSWSLYNVVATNMAGTASESVRAAADNQRGLLNMWRLEDGFLFSRAQDLRLLRRGAPDLPVKYLTGAADRPMAEGAWANAFRGKYAFDSSYGRSLAQNYRGVQFGFDKAREGDFYNGKIYYGFLAGLADSDVGFASGSGKLDSKSVGAYAAWQGSRGHFLDLALRLSKIGNEYSYTDSGGHSSLNRYSAWAYGLSAQYGWRKDLQGGLFVEPQAGFTLGRMRDTSYTLANQLTFRQEANTFLTGRLGLLFGKNFGANNANYGGSVYAKAMINHDFIGAADATAAFGNSSLKVEPLGDKDTWADLTLGASVKIAGNSTAFVELTKTVGGHVKTDWQINGGFAWTWDAAPPSKTRRITQNANGSQALAVSGAAEESAGGGAETDALAARSADGAAAMAQDADAQAAAANGYLAGYDHATPGYVLEPLTVEADRPAWEKNLSPGTVSVVRPADYEGEQKTLPDLLQTVPGVYVHKVNGEGHYSVARIRGSTGGQTSVYIDGVLVNLSSDVAVDLSLIPIENVVRVEVYRGYVPARFAGSPLGGAINIVTKRPNKTGGSVSYGMRSFGGYTGSLEVTAPLGSGSLLAAVNRDQARGDFDYTFKNIYLPGGSANGDYHAQDRTRLGNDFQHTDGLIKWQDEHWTVKAAYKRSRVGGLDPTSEATDAVNGYPWATGSTYRYATTRRIATEDTSILIGRRQTVGNLDWGWRLNYGYNKKHAWDPANPTGSKPAGWYYSFFRNTRKGLTLDASWKLGESHLVEAFADYADETLKTRYSEGSWGASNDFHDLHDSAYFLNRYKVKKHYLQIQDTITLDRSGTLKFAPLIRTEKQTMTTGLNDGGEWKNSYNLALKKDLNENLTLRASYGKYHRYPNFFEIFGDGYFVAPTFAINRGKIALEHGKQWDVSVNARGRALGAETDVTLTYFRRDVKDLSGYAFRASGQIQYMSQGDGKAQGIEIESSLKWKRWDFAAAFTWNDTEITRQGPSTPLFVGDRFIGTPEWETNARLSYRFPGEKLSAFVEHHYLGKVTGARFGVAVNDPIGIFNLGAKYTVNKNFKLTVGVNDLLNEGPKQMGTIGSTYYRTVAYPLQGRTYYMTMQYLF